MKKRTGYVNGYYIKPWKDKNDISNDISNNKQTEIKMFIDDTICKVIALAFLIAGSIQIGSWLSILF